MPSDQIQYSNKYEDDQYEYRQLETIVKCIRVFMKNVFELANHLIVHVILPPDLSKYVPRTFLMTETEWRNLGVQQSPGWIHYMIHNPEPHILLFRRPRSS